MCGRSLCALPLTPDAHAGSCGVLPPFGYCERCCSGHFPQVPLQSTPADAHVTEGDICFTFFFFFGKESINIYLIQSFLIYTVDGPPEPRGPWGQG